jgi:hypothetical protein
VGVQPATAPNLVSRSTPSPRFAEGATAHPHTAAPFQTSHDIAQLAAMTTAEFAEHQRLQRLQYQRLQLQLQLQQQQQQHRLDHVVYQPQPLENPRGAGTVMPKPTQHVESLQPQTCTAMHGTHVLHADSIVAKRSTTTEDVGLARCADIDVLALESVEEAHSTANAFDCPIVAMQGSAE